MDLPRNASVTLMLLLCFPPIIIMLLTKHSVSHIYNLGVITCIKHTKSSLPHHYLLASFVLIGWCLAWLCKVFLQISPSICIRTHTVDLFLVKFVAVVKAPYKALMLYLVTVWWCWLCHPTSRFSEKMGYLSQKLYEVWKYPLFL